MCSGGACACALAHSQQRTRELRLARLAPRSLDHDDAMAPSAPTKPLSKLTVAELKALLKERDLEQTVSAF